MVASTAALALCAHEPEALGGWTAALSLFALAGLAWLFTYALHSTLLLGSAWIATRRMPDSRAGLRERVWKFALLAAFVTASVQFGLGFEPLGGRLPLQRARAQVERTVEAELAQSERAPSAPALAPRGGDPLLLSALLAGETLARVVESAASVELLGTAPDRELEPQAAAAEPAPNEAADAPQLAAVSGPWGDSGGWTRWAFASCVLGAFGGLLLFALLWVRLNGCLRDRVALLHGPLAEKLATLCRRAGLRRRVRLSVAPSLGAPISMGTFRPEICIPPRVLLELSEEEQEALLAHELAHIVRRDPAWLAVCRLCEGVFFFQPLNRMARREIEDCAEFLSDAWAVRHTGLRFSLANCLTRIAEWIVGDRRALPAPAMAHGRSRLRHRVELLLDEHASIGVDHRPAWLAPACAAFGATLIAVVPCVSASEELAESGDTGGLPFLPQPASFHDRGRAPEEPEAPPGEADEFAELRAELDLLAEELPLAIAEAARIDPNGAHAADLLEIQQKLQATERTLPRLRALLAAIEHEFAALSDAELHARPAAAPSGAEPAGCAATTTKPPTPLPLEEIQQ